MAYGKLRRCSAARKALLRDLVTDLILNGKIETTESKAKELKKLADKMVTLAKTNTLASRRQAAKLVRFERMRITTTLFKSFSMKSDQSLQLVTVVILELLRLVSVVETLQVLL